MAIFSSSKRKKEASANGPAGSPPLVQGGAFSRSQSGPIGVNNGVPGDNGGLPGRASQTGPVGVGGGGGGAFSQPARYGDLPGPGPASSGIPISVSSQNISNTPVTANVPANSLSSSAPASSSSIAPPLTGPTPPSTIPSSTSAAGHTVLYPWSQRRLNYLNGSPPPFPRYGHSVNPTASLPNGDLYIFGGLVSNAVKNDLYVLGCSVGGSGGSGTGANGPPGSLSVSLVATRGEVPGPRVGHASVGVGNVLIVWGGDTKSRPEERQDDSLYLLNLSTRDWTRVKTSGPAPEGRYGHAAAMVGSRFFVFGGQKDDGGFMNDLVWFDLQKLKAGAPKWTFVDYAAVALAPPKRTGHTAVTHGDCIYIFGGTDGQYHYNDTWCYDTNSQRWTELSCIGYIPVPREGHAATLVDDVMYVFGGRGVDGKDLEDLAAFKITNQRWFMFQNMGPAPSGRSGHAMATWQNKVYVLGGESYTSTRADDPSFVHVLDTSKIKYPPDNRAPQSRKSSIPAPGSIVSSPPVATNSTSPLANGSPPNGIQPTIQVQSPAQLPPSDRAVSPTRLPNGMVAAPSFSQVVGDQTSSPPSTNTSSPPPSKIAKRATSTIPPGGGSIGAPSRPPRPGEEIDRRATMDPSLTLASVSASSRLEDRAMSPSGSSIGQARTRAMSPSTVGGGGTSPTTATGPRPRFAASTGNTPPQDQDQFAGLPPAVGSISVTSAGTGDARTQSPTGAAESDQAARTTSPAPPDAFYCSGNAPTSALTVVNGNASSTMEGTRAQEEEIAALKAREKWMKAALDLATRKGFVPSGTTPSLPGTSEDEEVARSLGLDSGAAGPNRLLVGALVQLKQELTRAKAALAEQAQVVDERASSAARGKASALQEASYYRAKLAALEAGSIGDAGKLERERSRELELKLTDALTSKSVLEQQVTRLQNDLNHQAEMRASVEERHAVASSRADAAESLYSRALTDYADLQRRAHGHEAMVQEQLEQLAQNASTVQLLMVENTQLKELVETTDATIKQHFRAVEETQLTLAAAHVRSDELYTIWEGSQAELTELRARVAQLQSDLDVKHHESSAAAARAAELERLLKANRDEHAAMKALTGGSLAELLAAHRNPKSKESSEGHPERLRAIEEEAATLRQLHQDARAKTDSALAELAETRAREVSLQAQVVQLRAEVSTLRNQHAQALDEASRLKSATTDREGDLREVARAREAAEVKVGLLRSIMSDHGLSVTDDDLATRFPPMSGNETPEQLHRRVQELETRLEQRTRAHQELESSHDDTRRELQEAEHRYRDASSQRQQVEDHLENLRGSTTSPAETARAARAADELAALQARHDQLDQTHQRAIAYVKGTEKMLRRMKEELTRAKQKNEELEADVVAHADLRNELDLLRQQLRDLASSSDKASKENEDLQRRIQALQTDYDRQLASQQNDADAKIHDLEEELTAMDQELDRVRRDLEDTLAHYQELQVSIKNGAGNGGGDAKRLEQELSAAVAKADWLKRENEGLETRCEIAEQKISILLDHMEGTADNFEGSQISHDETADWSGDRPRDSASEGGSDYSHTVSPSQPAKQHV